MTNATTKTAGIAMSTKIAAVLVAVLMTFGIAGANEGGEGIEQVNVRLDDVASMQRGAKQFFNYCSGCHSLQYLRYSRIAEDLKLDPKEVEKNFMFNGGKIGDPIVSRMPAADATRWFGKAPPDLSLEARSKGSDWIYSYLKSFYVDPSRPLGWNNTVVPNASMPNALWELQGIQAAIGGGHEGVAPKLELHTPGRQSPEEFDRTVRDITAFLQYAGEPAALQREAMGVWVLLYLGLFTLLAYLLKHEFWKDVH